MWGQKMKVNEYLERLHRVLILSSSNSKIHESWKSSANIIWLLRWTKLEWIFFLTSWLKWNSTSWKHGSTIIWSRDTVSFQMIPISAISKKRKQKTWRPIYVPKGWIEVILVKKSNPFKITKPIFGARLFRDSTTPFRTIKNTTVLQSREGSTTVLAPSATKKLKAFDVTKRRSSKLLLEKPNILYQEGVKISRLKFDDPCH